MSDVPSGKLKEQDLSNLDVTKLTPSSPEVISRQATINIGTIGHVAHGKSTIVKAVSGVQTVRFKNELERNITIKLDPASDDNQQSTSSDTNNRKHFKFDLSSSKTKVVKCYDERNLDNINAALLTAEKCLEKCSDESKDVTKNNNKRLLLHGTKSTTKKYANSNSRREKRETSLDRNNSVQKDAIETDSLNSTEHNDEKSNDSFSNLKLSDITHRLMNIDNTSMLDDSVESSSFTDTATIMIPQVLNQKVDGSFSYMISNDRIRDFILSGQMMLNDNADDAYNPTEIDEIVDDEIINGVHYYLVKWKNWSKGFGTWEHFGSLIKAQKLLFKYELKKDNKNFENPKSINAVHLMLSRNIISRIFEISIAEFGLSLPAITSEELFNLSIDLEIGKTFTQAYRKKFLSSQLAIVSLGYYRQEQLNKLLQWEIDINLMGTKIKVENDVDLEGPPNSFAYSHKYIPRCGIIISDDPPIGCDCIKNCESSIDCCNEMSGFSSVYDSNKNITIAPGYPVFECNKKCKCSAECTNRVVQLGSSVNICIYKTKKRGWGVKALSNIQKGQYVGNYVGEIITVEESERRIENNSSRVDLMWNLDFDDVEDFKYTIDGTHFANFTCFINHSCNANLNVYAVWVNCLDRNLPQLALFANKEILVGEELSTDYFSRCSQDVLKKSGVRCQCNMKNCKGYYF